MATSQNSVDVEIRLATQKFLSELQNLQSSYAGAMHSVKGESNATAASLKQAADKFISLKISADDAAARLSELQGKAQALGRELASTATPTRAQQGELNKLRDAVRAAKDEVTNQNAALDKARAALGTYGIDTKNLASAQVSLNAELKKAQTSAQDLSSNIRNQASASKEAASATQQHAGLLGELKNAAAGYIGVNLIKNFFDTAAAQEANRKALDQLTGSTKAGGAEMDYLRGVADRLGVKIDDAARAYVSLSASTKGTNLEGQNTRAIFEAVVGAMAKLGKSSADTERALVAVSQMASKGTVSMEELRGQLGESLPGAMQAAAQAMGVTVAELDNMVASGTVTADVLLPKLAEQLNKTFGTAPPDTLNSALAQLQNKITGAYSAMADSGGAEVMRSVLQGLGGALAAVADIANAAMQAFVLFGKSIGITAGAIAQALRGDMSGALQTWRTEMAQATDDAANGIERVRKAVGLLPDDAAKSGSATAAAMLPPKSAAEQLAAAFTASGNAAQGAGTQSAAAAESITQKFALNTRQGVLDLANAFAFAGDKAGEMQKKVEETVAKMSAQELSGFAQALHDSYAQGEIDAQNLSRLNTMVLGASFEKLGMDAQAAMGGVSQKTGDAIAAVDSMATALANAGQTGPAAARAIGEALSQAVNRADTQAGLDAVKARIEDLRSKLGDTITNGLLDQAAAKARDLKNALDDAVPGINSVEEALRKLGVTSDASLKQTAATAKQAYDTLAQSGQASARELDAAFAKAAQAAIAANKGVAPAWVEAQAAVRGYKVESDAAGQSTLKLADSVDKSSGAMRSASSSAGQLSQSVKAVADAYSDAEAKAAAASGQFLVAAHAQKNADTAKSSITNAPAPASQFIWTRTAIIDYLTQSGLDPLLAEQLSTQFVDSSGNVPYLATQAQQKWGGQYGTLSFALGKMAEYYKYDQAGKIEAQTTTAWAQSNQPGAKKPTPAPAPGQPPAPAPAPAPAQAIDRTVNVYIGPYNNPYGIPTNATGQAAIERMARDVVDTLQSAKTQVTA